MRAKFTPHKTKEYQLPDLCIIIFKFNLIEDIRILGKDRLKALHIHDTDYVRDLHTLPFTQKIDYHAVVKALAEIDYDGDFTYEADGFYAKFPEELFPQTAKFMCEVGRYLIAKFYEFKE